MELRGFSLIVLILLVLNFDFPPSKEDAHTCLEDHARGVAMQPRNLLLHNIHITEQPRGLELTYAISVRKSHSSRTI